MSIFYFSGKENYLKKEELKRITNAIEFPELNIANFYEYEPSIIEFSFLAPFMGKKKIGILHFFPEQEDFLSAVKELPDFTEFYIITSDLPDQRKKVVRELIKLVQTKEFNKISEDLLYKCIVSRLQRWGYEKKEIEAVKDTLMECFHGYILHSEMDLTEVQKHVQMLAFSGALTPENIRIFSPDSSDYRAYKLSAMLLSKDTSCVSFAKQLLEQGETAIGIFSLVAYQIRICYKAILFREENYLSLIGIRNYQIYKRFADYHAKTYKTIYTIFMDGIGRVKKGENANAIMTDCLMYAITILQEE